MEDTTKAATKFQAQTCAIIERSNPDYVINTDQTGCEYRTPIKRTLSFKGEKSTIVGVQNINKITHSYTAQYSITLSGKLLPQVFVCLQETAPTFGPRVQVQVDALIKKFKNVFVTCTKSGKLCIPTYESFLDNVIKRYVQNNKFLLILDSWGGHINPMLYDDRFYDDKHLPTCTLKVIPPKCTPLCQPCDVYFFRQVKSKILFCTFLFSYFFK